MARPNRAATPFAEALADLLAERGLSQRQLAERVGIDHSHLSRLLRRAESRINPSADLLARITHELDLPSDFFIETRLARIYERLEVDESFREKVYAMVGKLRPARKGRPH